MAALFTDEERRIAERRLVNARAAEVPRAS